MERLDRRRGRRPPAPRQLDQRRRHLSGLRQPKGVPLGGARTDEVDPRQAGGATLPDGASPFGWHDTDGDLDPDFTETRGNNHAFQLVVDGLKLQPCSPGFVDGRDAILAADVADYEGDHVCAIWAAFAERGLGAAASQGSTASWTDGTQAFDLPAACAGHIFSSSFGHGDTAHWSATVQ